MTIVETQPYPELRQLFGAYLNADVAREFGSATSLHEHLTALGCEVHLAGAGAAWALAATIRRSLGDLAPG
jgi:hypothetical protein